MLYRTWHTIHHVRHMQYQLLVSLFNIIIFLCVGPVPKQVDLNHMVRMETARKQEHAQTHMRQRRMSDSMVSQCVW